MKTRAKTFGAVQAAAALGVSVQTLARWFVDGKATDVARDARGWRIFTKADVERIRRERAAAPRRAHKVKRGKAPKFLAADFFCGAGGTTRGLLDAGGYVIAGIDKDARCEKTYVANNRNTKGDRAAPVFMSKDIFPASKRHPGGQQKELKEELSALIEKHRKAYPSAPLFFAICAPCQPFTSLSKKEMSKRRVAVRKRDMNLLDEAAKFVSKFKPEVVLSENVSGINDPKFGGVWEDFQRRLRRLGYVTGKGVVCASNFGIPQFRKRSILMAVRKDVHFEKKRGARIVVPTADPEARRRTVRGALSKLPPIGPGERHPTIVNHRTRGMSALNRKRLRAAPPGMSNAYMANTKSGDLSLRCHRRVNKKLKVRCFSDVYTRMHPDRPSPTITTKCHSVSNGRFGHYDTKQVRGISLQEAAILQSFRRDYVFYPTDQVEPVARMIGNAVPPRLAAFFARRLMASVRRPHAGARAE